MSSEIATNHYFVDEAGDPVLFGRGGKVLVGTKGCSHYFMLGVAKVANPAGLAAELDQLRADLLADPYFKDVPSMQRNAGKTAVAFHAKDDLPEVRREVFKLLGRSDVEVHIGIRRKQCLVELARKRRTGDPEFRMHPNDIYDGLVAKLFAHLLHKGDENRILFARRGKTDRVRALGEAIGTARERFQKRSRKVCDQPTDVRSACPSEHPCLQVIDYYLWALQRMLERNEDRFFELVRPAFAAICDQDCRIRKPGGEWYSRAEPLTMEKIRNPAVG